MIAAILGSAPVSAAWASCPTSPQNFSAHDCEVDYYGTPISVCTSDAAAFECDVSWSEDDAAVTIVSDYDTSLIVPYEAWGSVVVDGGVELFCCGSNPQFTPTMVHIEGSDYADRLEFTWDALSYNLSGVGGGVAASIDGNDGPDIINGSHTSGTSITETLNGGLKNDTIRGNDDDDTLNGDGGDDVMLGGAGDDTMSGGTGSDEMLGCTGNDGMNGNAGRDRMSGGDDNDVMDGGTEGDILCGDGESGGLGDELLDGDAVDEGAGLRDILWAATSGDLNFLDSSSTSRDGFASCTGPGCAGSTIISTRPACP